MKRCRFLQQTTVIQNAVGERNQSETCTEIKHTERESLEMNAGGGPSSGWPITIDLYLQGNLKHEYLHQNTPEPHVNVREVLAATREKAESRDPVLKSNFRGNTCLFPTWQEPFSPAGCPCMASGCWDQSRHNGVKDVCDLLYVVHQASTASGALGFGNSKWQWIREGPDAGDNS